MDADDIPVCDECGQRHVTRNGKPACIRHRTGGYSRPEVRGTPCTQNPMKGQRVCGAHGGRAGHMKAAAASKLAREEAEKELATFGVPVSVGNYADELLELIMRVKGHVVWLSVRVAQLDPSDLVWGKTRSKVGGDDYGITSEAKPNAWLALYDHWTDRLAKLLVDAVRIGLDERRVRIAEVQGEAFARAIDGIVSALGHNPNDPETAGIVARHLRLIEGAG